MQLRDRLSALPRRRWLAAVVVLALVAASVVVAAWPDDEPAASRATTTPPVLTPEPVLLDALEGGFEGASLRAGGWRLEASRGTRAEITARTVHHGKGAVSLDTSGSAGTISLGAPPRPVVEGQEYGASAFAIPTSGRPQLRLEFLDEQGRELDESVADLSDKDGVWSRTSVQAVAPQGVATARVVVALPRDSAVVVDDVDWWTTGLPDPGFEAPDGSGGARSWSVSTPPGTSIERTTGESHGGGAALEVRDASRTESAFVASPLVPAPTGTELEVRGWVRASRGETTLRVRWFDSTRRLLPDAPTNGARATARSWSEVRNTVAVPDGAAYAQLQIATGEAGTSASTWDDMSMRPAPALPEQDHAVAPVATMQGFANTKTSLVSSVGNVPKFSTVTSGAPGVFQFADLQTGKVEFSHQVPGILNGWALTPSRDERMIFVGGQGHVWRFDTRTRSFTDLGQATPRATRVFDLVTAPDGRIWGGSYPGGDVWSINPTTGAFTSAGAVGNDNDYARTLAVDDENVYVGTGSIEPNIVQISTTDPPRRIQIAPPTDVGKGFLTQLEAHDGFLTALFPDGTRGLYDVTARRWVDTPVLDTTGNLFQRVPGSTAPDNQLYFFRDGKFWRGTVSAAGIRQQAVGAIPVPRNGAGTVVRIRLDGQLADWVIVHDSHTQVVAFKVPQQPSPKGKLSVLVPRKLAIHLKPSPLRVKSMAARGDDVIVGGYGGASLSVLDTRPLGSDGAPRLNRLVGGASTPKFFGEVEGMITNGRFQYFGTYPKARIFRFDTTKPWKDRTNPRMVVDLGAETEQDRPIAWTASGARTFFGTIPDYGIRGGVLGWFDGNATSPVVIDPPVHDQSVVGLTARRQVVYGGTSRWGGLGSRPSSGPPSVFAYDSDRRNLLWTVTPDPAAQSVGSVLVDDDGRLWAATRNRVFQLDPATGRTVRTIPLGITGDPTSADPDDGDPAAATFVSTAMVSLRGHLYVVTGGQLLQLDPQTARIRQVAEGGISPSRLAVVGDDLYFPVVTTLMRARAL